MNQGGGWGGGGGGYGPPGGGGYGPPQGGGGYGPPQGGGGYGPPQGGGGHGPPQGGGGYGPPQGGGYGPPQAGGYAQPGAMVQQGGTLALDTGFFFMLWILFFIKPKIVINGQMERRPWGKSQIQLPAGVYQVTISFPYGLMSNAGQATLQQVQIMPGCVTQVTYRAPWIVFLSGSIWQIPPRPADAMAMPGR